MRLIRSYALAAGALALSAQAAAAAFVPVVLSGDPMPGIPGTKFLDADWSAIAANGQLIMRGEANNPNTFGLWSGTIGSLQKVASNEGGTVAPGTTQRFANFQSARVDTLGRVTFHAELDPSGWFGSGLWHGAPGAIQPVAMSNDLAPGTDARFGYALSNFRANGAGQVTFTNQLVGATVTADNDLGVWSGSPGAVQLVARESGLVPAAAALPAGTTFKTINPIVSLNDNGQLAFYSSHSGATSPIVWSGAAGDLRPVVRAGVGFAAPDVPGARFEAFESVSINNAGQLAVSATIAGSGITGGQNDRGLWVGAPGALRLAARRGDHPPGTDPGTRFGSGGFLGPPFGSARVALNGSGQVAFIASVDAPGLDPSYGGVWAGSAGDLHLVARTGWELPEAFRISSIELNDAGDVVIVGGTDLGLHQELWLYELGSRSLQRVLAEGDPLDVDPGIGVDMRVVDSVAIANTTGGEDGVTSSLTDDRKLILDIGFTDNTRGVFLTDLSTVPEPHGALVAAGASLLALRRRRHRTRRASGR